MRRFLVLASMIMALVAAGCSDSAGEEAAEKDNKQEKKTQEVSQAQGNSEEETVDEAEDKTEETDEETENMEPIYSVSENWTIVPEDGEANEQVALITIDDAPDTYAVDMAHTLKELDVNAIFFVNGHFLDTPEEEEMLKEIHEMGFVIGNHTFSHANLQQISEEEQKEEILNLNERIEEIIGEKPRFFRAPHGALTDYSIQLAEEEGMTVMNWTYGYDYFEPYMDAEKLTEAMVTGEGPEVDVAYSLLQPGANLLMHDREWTAEALPGIVEGLREQGYELVNPHLIK